MRFWGLAVLTAAMAVAQVSVPLVGWLPEGTGVRPIEGLPAAARLGAPLNAGRGLIGAVVSPAQNFILATAQDTREVVVVTPSGAATPLSVPLSPDQIALSPSGTAAVLWYSATRRFGIVSGLPGAPSVREVDAPALGSAPAALAVSDDGQWSAAAASNGVYAWGSDGSPHLLYGGADGAALAFFAGGSELAMASTTQIASINDPGAGSAATLATGTFSPVGVAVSADKSKIIVADGDGTIYSVNVSNSSMNTAACECRPSGVFPLNGGVFRLTGGPSGPVRLFDASANAVLSVPRAGLAPKRTVHPQQTSAALPTLAIHLGSFQVGFMQQPTMTVTSSAAYGSDISGTVTLAFASSVGGQDQTIQFSTGGTTVGFTIPAGSTQANFSGAPSVTFLTGTMAGTITLTASITAPTPVATAATQSITTTSGVPFISSVSFTTTPGAVTVVVTGFSSTRDVVSAVVDFAPSSNATINESGTVSQNELTVSVSPYFQAYYATTASYATGSEFQLTIPFSVTGNSADVVAATVTLVNSKGASNPVSSK